jgi:hypothetical protein
VVVAPLCLDICKFDRKDGLCVGVAGRVGQTALGVQPGCCSDRGASTMNDEIVSRCAIAIHV